MSEKITISRFKLTRLYILIALLSLALLIAFYFFILANASHRFIGPVANHDAYERMDNYRGRLSWYKKSRLVWYDTSDIRNYLDNKFPELITKLRGRQGYVWKVGFYFVRTFKGDNNSDPRLDFYVVPTLVDPKTGDVVDCYDTFDKKDTSYLPKPGPLTVTLGISPDSISYNTGHIWP